MLFMFILSTVLRIRLMESWPNGILIPELEFDIGKERELTLFVFKKCLPELETNPCMLVPFFCIIVTSG